MGGGDPGEALWRAASAGEGTGGVGSGGSQDGPGGGVALVPKEVPDGPALELAREEAVSVQDPVRHEEETADRALLVAEAAMFL